MTSVTPAGVLCATGVAIQRQTSFLCSPRAAHLVQSHSVVSSCFPVRRGLRASEPRAAPFDELRLTRRQRGLCRTSDDNYLVPSACSLPPHRGGKRFSEHVFKRASKLRFFRHHIICHIAVVPFTTFPFALTRHHSITLRLRKINRSNR